MLQNNKRKGNYGETVAVGFLQQKGYSILERQFKRGKGEIDIIAEQGEYIVFVEVKYRQTLAIGLPREAVTKGKQKAILQAALHYISEKNLDDQSFRFDVVEIVGKESLAIEHIENAFTVNV